MNENTITIQSTVLLGFQLKDLFLLDKRLHLMPFQNPLRGY